MENNNSSNTNTILIVVVLIILVGVGVWWFTMRSAPAEDTSGIDVDVNLPTGDNAAGGTVLEGAPGGSATE